MKKYTMEQKVVTPNDYTVWAINKETKEEETFEVQAFSRQEAMNFAKSIKVDENDENSATLYKIKVVAESGEKFNEECNKYVQRCADAKIKNNARSIERIEALAEVIKDRETLDKVLEIVGLTAFVDYANI